MAKHLPPLDPLRAFEAAARHLSVVRAAAELGVSHSAVSHQIRTLENAVGLKLFRRAGSRLQLTPRGAQLLPTLSWAFEAISEATMRLRHPTPEGDLAVSCVPALLSFWLVPRLGDFVRRFPGVRMRLISTNMVEELDDARIHICIRYARDVGPTATCGYFPASNCFR